MLDYFWSVYEKAKAKLFAYLGNFLTLRDKLMRMRTRIDIVVAQARKLDNASIVVGAVQLRGQIADAWNKQIELEQEVMAARGKLAELDRAKTTGADSLGFAISTTVLIAAIGMLGAAAAGIVVHTQRVNYLHRLLDEIESKTLTPAQAAEMRGGLGFGDMTTPVMMLALVGAGIWFMSRRR